MSTDTMGADGYECSPDEFKRLIATRVETVGIPEVADELTVARGTVSRWANGHTAPAEITRRGIKRYYIIRGIEVQ